LLTLHADQPLSNTNLQVLPNITARHCLAWLSALNLLLLPALLQQQHCGLLQTQWQLRARKHKSLKGSLAPLGSSPALAAYLSGTCSANNDGWGWFPLLR
jgi:hypothetical protein